MAKYRKKPIVVEAEKWNPGLEIDGVCDCGREPFPHIHTLEGTHIVSPGDYVITGIAGEKYPCKSEIFEATYVAVAGETGEGEVNQMAKVDELEAEIERLKAENERYWMLLNGAMFLADTNIEELESLGYVTYVEEDEDK